MADPNQKLFSQIADLGRNINSLAESIKKNTSATESLISSTDKSTKSEKESATTSNKASTANPKESEKGEGAIKDLTKAISGLLGEKGPLMGKIAEMAKGSVSKGGEGPNKDFSNIAGGLKGIIKAFQEGGVAKKEGKYLVGENGPEVVKLPKGAGVIPINVKDLMEGLKNVPEFSSLLKNSKEGSLNFFGNPSDPGLIDSEGINMNLSGLLEKYEEAQDNAKDDNSRKSTGEIVETLYSLIGKGKDGIDGEITKIEKEALDLEIKNKLSGEDLNNRSNTWVAILKNLSKDKDYYNGLAVAKAKLLATQSLISKEKSEDKSAEQVLGKSDKSDSKLENLPDTLDSGTKEKTDELKKSEEVVNPKKRKKEKSAEEGPKKETKGSSLLSKIGGGAEDVKKETKVSSLLSKIGGGAEDALFSAADKATESLGAASPFAKKGLGALKGVIDKKGGLKGVFSKKEETKTDLGKKITETSAASKIGETPSLVNNVKKLNPLAKKEAAKDKEAPEETKAAETKPSADLMKSAADKSGTDKKSETPASGNNGLGSNSDMQDIKNALTRIAGLLEGPLTVSAIDQPFRPDSRRI
jgi:hypothetical protein